MSREDALIDEAAVAAAALLVISERAQLDGAERDAITLVRFICWQIVEGERSEKTSRD